MGHRWATLGSGVLGPAGRTPVPIWHRCALSVCHRVQHASSCGFPPCEADLNGRSFREFSIAMGPAQPVPVRQKVVAAVAVQRQQLAA